MGEELRALDPARRIEDWLEWCRHLPSPATLASGFPAADDLGNIFQFESDFNDYYRGARDIAFSRSLNPELQTYDQWLAQRAREIPLA